MKRRKPIGNKRVDISTECRDMIMKAYNDFSDWRYENDDLAVESKIKDNDDFKFTKLTINRPLRLKYVDLVMPEDTAKLKDAEIALCMQIAELYNEKYAGVELSDKDFFDALKKESIKVTAAQIKKLRQIFGTKDEQSAEVCNNPYKAVAGDWAWDSDLTDTEVVTWKDDIEEYLDKNVRPYAPDFVEDEAKRKIGYEIPLTREFYKYVELRKSEDIFSKLKELEAQEAELMTKILG